MRFHKGTDSKSSHLPHRYGAFGMAALLATSYFGAAPRQAYAAFMGGQSGGYSEEYLSREESIRLAWQSIDDSNKASSPADRRELSARTVRLLDHADSIAPLDEGLMAIVSFIKRNFLEDPKGSLQAAKANIERNPWGVYAHYEYAMALAGVGEFEEARKVVRILAALPKERQGEYVDKIDFAKHVLGTKTWEVTMSFSQDYWRGYGRDEYKKKGYYECFCMEDTPFQKTTFEVKGAERFEVQKDVGGNQCLHIWPNENEIPTVVFRITTVPYCVDLNEIGSSPYILPPELEGYLRPTIATDPTSDKVRSVATTLVGKTRGETIQNVIEWMEANFRYSKDPTTDKWFSSFYYDTPNNLMTLDSLIEHGLGHCWEDSRLTVGLLRACGIAARQRLGIDFLQENGDLFMSYHLIAEAYEPTIGWIPVLQPGGGERLPGSRWAYYIPMYAEVPDTDIVIEGTKQPLTNVEKAFFKFYYGGGNVNGTLTQQSYRLVDVDIDSPYQLLK